MVCLLLLLSLILPGFQSAWSHVTPAYEEVVTRSLVDILPPSSGGRYGFWSLRTEQPEVEIRGRLRSESASLESEGTPSRRSSHATVAEADVYAIHQSVDGSVATLYLAHPDRGLIAVDMSSERMTPSDHRRRPSEGMTPKELLVINRGETSLIVLIETSAEKTVVRVFDITGDQRLNPTLLEEIETPGSYLDSRHIQYPSHSSSQQPEDIFYLLTDNSPRLSRENNQGKGLLQSFKISRPSPTGSTSNARSSRVIEPLNKLSIQGSLGTGQGDSMGIFQVDNPSTGPKIYAAAVSQLPTDPRRRFDYASIDRVPLSSLMLYDLTDPSKMKAIAEFHLGGTVSSRRNISVTPDGRLLVVMQTNQDRRTQVVIEEFPLPSDQTPIVNYGQFLKYTQQAQSGQHSTEGYPNEAHDFLGTYNRAVDRAFSELRRGLRGAFVKRSLSAYEALSGCELLALVPRRVFHLGSSSVDTGLSLVATTFLHTEQPQSGAYDSTYVVVQGADTMDVVEVPPLAKERPMKHWGRLFGMNGLNSLSMIEDSYGRPFLMGLGWNVAPSFNLNGNKTPEVKLFEFTTGVEGTAGPVRLVSSMNLNVALDANLRVAEKRLRPYMTGPGQGFIAVESSVPSDRSVGAALFHFDLSKVHGSAGPFQPGAMVVVPGADLSRAFVGLAPGGREQAFQVLTTESLRRFASWVLQPRDRHQIPGVSGVEVSYEYAREAIELARNIVEVTQLGSGTNTQGVQIIQKNQQVLFRLTPRHHYDAPRHDGGADFVILGKYLGSFRPTEADVLLVAVQQECESDHSLAKTIKVLSRDSDGTLIEKQSLEVPLNDHLSAEGLEDVFQRTPRVSIDVQSENAGDSFAVRHSNGNHWYLPKLDVLISFSDGQFSLKQIHFDSALIQLIQTHVETTQGSHLGDQQNHDWSYQFEIRNGKIYVILDVSVPLGSLPFSDRTLLPILEPVLKASRKYVAEVRINTSSGAIEPVNQSFRNIPSGRFLGEVPGTSVMVVTHEPLADISFRHTIGDAQHPAEWRGTDLVSQHPHQLETLEAVDGQTVVRSSYVLPPAWVQGHESVFAGYERFLRGNQVCVLGSQAGRVGAMVFTIDSNGSISTQPRVHLVPPSELGLPAGFERPDIHLINSWWSNDGVDQWLISLRNGPGHQEQQHRLALLEFNPHGATQKLTALRLAVASEDGQPPVITRDTPTTLAHPRGWNLHDHTVSMPRGENANHMVFPSGRAGACSVYFEKIR